MTPSISEDEYLAHYGTPRHSGRYPWGSGGDENSSVPRTAGFLDHVAEARRQGLSDTEIAKGMDMTTTQFRARNSAEKNAARQADIAMAMRLKTKGMSVSEIGRQMKRNESSVRAMLEPGAKEKTDRLQGTVNMLKEQVAKKGFIDVGKGVEYYIGVGRQTLDTAVAALHDQGYALHPVQVPQLGVGGNQKTNMKVLAPPGTTYRDIASNVGAIQSLYDQTTDNGGRTYFGILPPLSVSSKRLQVIYGPEGGSKSDGVIYVRPGVEKVSLGGKRYAQVRIMVDGTHYIKGMAMYKDDLPDGVDIAFNTNKSRTSAGKLAALKKLNDDPDNPFGAVISRQIGPIDPKTSKPTHLTSAMNIVNEEGNWDTWSRTLSSQFLSKQSPTLIKGQLDTTQQNKRAELDEIMQLTNPVVRKQLLEKFADSADSASVHLKAAQLPRQSSHVILPITTLKDNEIYAPNFNDGERVILIRHPHAGTFEIPELTVNNRNREAIRAIGKDGQDAVGINHHVAERLSGADFDGDSVIVIPQRTGPRAVKTSSPLLGLKNFDAKLAYPKYEGMKVMDARTKGIEMGKVSNLITDMNLQGASHEELARAVRHSMVVIDAEKHELNYRQSFIDNGIADLNRKYQNSAQGGASTLISRAGSTKRVPEAKLRKASQGGPVDPRTGKKVFIPTGVKVPDKKTGELVDKTMKVKKLEVAENAKELLSKNGGTVQERLYADHSNMMKALANEARRASLKTPRLKVSDSAKRVYAPEIKTLTAKLRVALENAPLERQALVIANRVYAAKRQQDPNMDDTQKKRVRYQSLQQARLNTGAGKTRIEITDREWEAIQAGAISHSRLEAILTHAKAEDVKRLATPKAKLLMTSVKTQRALAMAASGYTQAEIAGQLGVSLTTLKRAIGGGS